MKQNNFLKVFLVLGDRRKRMQIVGKGVIKRVSKQPGGTGCIKLENFEGTLWMDIHKVHSPKIVEFYTACIISLNEVFDIDCWALSSSTINTVKKFRKTQEAKVTISERAQYKFPLHFFIFSC